MRFVLAALADPHLPTSQRLGLGDLPSKRALGYLNWRRRRSAVHRPDVLTRLTDDLLAQRVDHVVVAGDLTNLALDSEIEAAAVWLDRFGDPSRTTVVPGNHDAYVPGALARALGRWTPWTAGDGADRPIGPEAFPTIRRRGPVVLIGLTSAVATAPFLATGRLGAPQREALSSALRGAERSFRVVVLHHPLAVERRHWAKRLVDARPARGAIRKAGADLVLHGHMHAASLDWIEGEGKRIPVVGLPSASADPAQAAHPAAYALIEIEGAPGAWSAVLRRRGFDGSGALRDLALEPLTERPART
jgi:3',5'-cyclic AMP phosphodiesterase CpdA